jgi:hypothetical protein
MATMRGMMSRLKLTVNEAKTRRRRIPEETFDFLGYTIGRCSAPRTGQVHKAYQAVDRHTCHRLRQWLRSKYRSPSLGYSRYSNESLHERLGLVRLKGRKRDFSCAKV